MKKNKRGENQNVKAHSPGGEQTCFGGGHLSTSCFEGSQARHSVWEGDAFHFGEQEGLHDEMKEKQINFIVTKKKKIHIWTEQGKCAPK